MAYCGLPQRRQTTCRRTAAAGRDRAKPIDRSWHLARTAQEMDVAELEYALIRCWEGFGHWQAECLASVAEFSGQRSGERIAAHDPHERSAKEFAGPRSHGQSRRYSQPAIQPAQAASKGGLVTRSGSGRSGVTYETTALGKNCHRPLRRCTRASVDRGGRARARSRQAPARCRAHARL